MFASLNDSGIVKDSSDRAIEDVYKKYIECVMWFYVDLILLNKKQNIKGASECVATQAGFQNFYLIFFVLFQTLSRNEIGVLAGSNAHGVTPFAQTSPNSAF